MYVQGCRSRVEEARVTETLPSKSEAPDAPASPTFALSGPAHRPLDILIVTSEAPPIVSGISTCIDRLGQVLET